MLVTEILKWVHIQVTMPTYTAMLEGSYSHVRLISVGLEAGTC